MIKCSYCNGTPKWVENKVIYGKNYGKSYMIWWCEPCDARVGCHQNTRMPLGTLANATLRKLRNKCHKLIDELWGTGEERHKMYKNLATAMNMDEIHIASCDEDMCKRVIEIMEGDEI